jgi:glycosyltransferase involved in cell wall biosynthesis
MKILQVTPFFSPVHGGSAEVPYHLSKELAKRGHEVTVYTSDFKLSHDYIDSIPKVRVRAFRTWSSWANLYVTPGMIGKAKQEIERFDVIHMHNYRTFQNIVVAHYARKYGTPYMLQAHGSLPRIAARQGLKQLYDTAWGYKLLRDASRVIAVTEIEAGQYKSMGISEDKVAVLPYGIDLDEFDNLPEKGEFRRKYGLDSDQKIILYLGRIHKIKGLDLLTMAFSEVLKKLNDARLVIVGPDDGYLPTLKKLVADLKISDKVLFVGPLYGRDKVQVYVDTDVYVLSSSYEIFGITVLEAMACGVPVIVSEHRGIAEVIDGRAGLAVPLDEEQLQNALLQMLHDDRIRQQFGTNGKALVREKFDWETIAEQVEKVYRRVQHG